MKLQSSLKTSSNLFPITFAPLLNLFCLLFMFMVVAPYLTFPNAIGIKLPKAITSDVVPDNSTIITVNSEDIIFSRGKVLSEIELKKLLQVSKIKNGSVLIKADGRSSLARVIDIWNICRDLGLEKINIATTIKNK